MGQGHRRVARAGREEFRQGGCLRAGDTGQRHHQHQQEQRDHGRVRHRQRAVMQDALKDREDRQHSGNQAGEQHGTAADAVGQPAAEYGRRQQRQRRDHHQCAGLRCRQLDHGFQEDAGIDLRREEDQRAAGGDAEEEQRHAPERLPVLETFAQRCLGQCILAAQFAEYRRLMQVEAAFDRDRQQ